MSILLTQRRVSLKYFRYVVEWGSFVCVVQWRRGSRIKSRYYCGQSIVPSLLLLAEHVEINSGPRFPCRVCSKAIRRNEQGIFCDRCELWSHAHCSGVTAQEYKRLGQLEDKEEWICPQCATAELSFADVNLNTDTHVLGDLLRNAAHDDKPFGGCNGTLVYGNLNIKSPVPKYDEVHNLPGETIQGYYLV